MNWFGQSQSHTSCFHNSLIVYCQVRLTQLDAMLYMNTFIPWWRSIKPFEQYGISAGVSSNTVTVTLAAVSNCQCDYPGASVTGDWWQYYCQHPGIESQLLVLTGLRTTVHQGVQGTKIELALAFLPFRKCFFFFMLFYSFCYL